MATPFAEFANLRMLWQQPIEAPASLREGLRAPVSLVVIEAYAELSPGGDGVDAGGTEIGSQSVTGNLTRWATVPEGADWLDAGSSWAWTDTGLRPPGLRAGEKLEAWEGPLASLPTASTGTRGWLTLTFLSPQGGIDALVAAEAGDEFNGIFAGGR
ncbi:MAG: hypothetical protein RLZZ468_533 [Cyanobacteriota bacterium]